MTRAQPATGVNFSCFQPSLEELRQVLRRCLCLGALVAAHCTAEQGLETAGSRQLGVSLPLVSGVDFQDLDLDAAEIRGMVTWIPPPNAALEVSAYVVYLSDSANSLASRLSLGSVLVADPLFLPVPENTSLLQRSHIFVHTRSSLGEHPDGTGVLVCDVRLQDSLYITNAVLTTVPWGVVDVAFYADPYCEGSPLRWAEASSTGHLSSYVAAKALDGSDTSAWASNCSSCQEEAVSLGVVGVCDPQSVRCVKMKQCSNYYVGGRQGMSSRITRIALRVQGEAVYTWKVLPHTALNSALREEILVIPSRRRRAVYVVFSEPPEKARETQEVNPGFSR